MDNSDCLILDSFGHLVNLVTVQWPHHGLWVLDPWSAPRAPCARPRGSRQGDLGRVWRWILGWPADHPTLNHSQINSNNILQNSYSMRFISIYHIIQLVFLNKMWPTSAAPHRFAIAQAPAKHARTTWSSASFILAWGNHLRSPLESGRNHGFLHMFPGFPWHHDHHENEKEKKKLERQETGEWVKDTKRKRSLTVNATRCNKNTSPSYLGLTRFQGGKRGSNLLQRHRAALHPQQGRFIKVDLFRCLWWVRHAAWTCAECGAMSSKQTG